jgi:hypothetical protein
MGVPACELMFDMIVPFVLLKCVSGCAPRHDERNGGLPDEYAVLGRVRAKAICRPTRSAWPCASMGPESARGA